MTCQNECPDCSCAPCGHLEYSEDYPFEVDSTPIGTQQDRWLRSPANTLTQHCALHPSDAECKIYED